MHRHGWIAVHRRTLLDVELRRGVPLCPLAAFVELEARANWKASTGFDPPLEAGQLFTTFPETAERWNWTSAGDTASKRRSAAERVRTLFRAWEREGRLRWDSMPATAGRRAGLLVTLAGYAERQYPARTAPAPLPHGSRIPSAPLSSASGGLDARGGGSHRLATEPPPRDVRTYKQNTDPEHQNTRTPAPLPPPPPSADYSRARGGEAGGSGGGGVPRGALLDLEPVDPELLADVESEGPIARIAFRVPPESHVLRALADAEFRFLNEAEEWRAPSTWRRVALLASLAPSHVTPPHPAREELRGWSSAPHLAPLSWANAQALDVLPATGRMALLENAGAIGAPLEPWLRVGAVTPECVRFVACRPHAAASLYRGGWLETLADWLNRDRAEIDFDGSHGSQSAGRVVRMQSHRTGRQ